MKTTRVVYRYSYVFKGELAPVRDSKAFPTEQDARSDAAGFIERGYGVVVWRELQRKIGNRWNTDFDDPITQPLDH
jgi:hypothetical protein